LDQYPAHSEIYPLSLNPQLINLYVYAMELACSLATFLQPITNTNTGANKKKLIRRCLQYKSDCGSLQRTCHFKKREYESTCRAGVSAATVSADGELVKNVCRAS